MGNSVSGSKERQVEDFVDFGSLSPQGVYTSPQDWNQQVVGHLIVDRKLAPFYRPLEEYDDGWDDDRILAARREGPNAQQTSPPDAPTPTSSKFHHHKHPTKSGKEPFRPTEASVYRGAIECPICFLYYPPNINRSRCCDQAICTECFVQIKRAEPTTTHLVSEPAACPYCVQDNFGVIYEPPPWRTGLVKDGQPSPSTPTRPDIHKVNSGSSTESDRSKRRKSFSADSPEVVTIDQIRPDWEAKLAAVRAAVTRRANRRIIMRQVGDRLIPIGVTSGRMIADAADSGAEGPESGSMRRRRRAHAGQEINQILGSVGLSGIGSIGGQDLEELMVMEAMRLSLLEHEEQQRRQNNSNNSASNSTPPVASGITNGTSISPDSSPSPSPRPPPSPATHFPVTAPQQFPSPDPTPSPRYSPSHPRLLTTSSPLSNADDAATSNARLGVVVPFSASSSSPPGHIHRRTGSSPSPPSGSTLAAVLSATQTAAAFLAPSELPPLPRSAPQTRAASPEQDHHERRGPARGEEEMVAARAAHTTPGKPQEPETLEVRGPPSVVIHPSGGEAVASSTSRIAFDPGPSSAAGTGTGTGDAIVTDALTASPVPLVATPVSEGTDNTLSQDDLMAGYKALPSSTESTVPLLGLDK